MSKFLLYQKLFSYILIITFGKNFKMINNWFFPIDTKELSNFQSLQNHQFGKKIKIHKKGNEIDLSTTQIALIGIGKDTPNAIRKALYSLSFPFKKLNIVDLGNDFQLLSGKRLNTFSLNTMLINTEIN